MNEGCPKAVQGVIPPGGLGGIPQSNPPREWGLRGLKADFYYSLYWLHKSTELPAYLM